MVSNNRRGPSSVSNASRNTSRRPDVRKFRVKVPGDPQNQGIASPSFTIAVTAATGPIAPESSANSSQPHEGQV